MDESAAIVHAVPAEPSEISDLASSFELFVEAESARFHGALRLLTRDRAEAEDLMQDAFLKVWERWGRVRTLEDPTSSTRADNERVRNFLAERNGSTPVAFML